MKLIGRIQKTNFRKFKLERMHRTALGLLSGTEVHLTLLPNVDNRMNHVELLLTTIPPSKWHSLCRITARMHDKPGAVASAVSALVDSGCNILIIETLTTAGQAEHELLAFVEPAKNRDADGFLSDLRNSLHRQLYANLNAADRLVVESPLVDELSALKRSAQLRLQSNLQEKTTSCNIDDVGIDVNPTELTKLFPLDADGKPEIPTRVLCYSDTEEKYVCMYFPPEDSLLTAIAIDHEEQPGVISQFAEVFKFFGANILNSYSRLRRTGQLAQWCIIVDMSSVNSIREVLTAIAGKTNSFKKFSELSISYTERLKRKPQTQNPFHFIDEHFAKETLVPREEIISPIASSIIPSNNPVVENFVLSGYYKTGKSTVLELVRRMAETNKNMAVVGWSLKGQPVTHFWQNVIDSLGKVVDANSSLIANTGKRLSRAAIDTTKSIQSVRFGIELKFNQPDQVYTFAREVAGELQRLCIEARKLGKERLLFLIDEGQKLLNPVDDTSKVALEIWQVVAEEVPNITWVFSASDRWKTSDGRSGLVAKLHELRMTPLRNTEALAMFEGTFRKNNIYIAREIASDAVEIAGRQPCYLQTLGNSIFEILATAPRNADVVDGKVLKSAIPKACIKLSAHFSELRKELSTVLGRTSLDEMLSTGVPEKLFQTQWMHGCVQKSASCSSYYFDVIPGLIPKYRTDRSLHQVDVLDGFSVTPLFHYWYKSLFHA